MPTSYTGNPTATQAPSPAPAPRSLPVISIPAGSEVRTIESITQQMKVEADFIGHIQSAVGLDVPVLNSGATGFTAPSYVAFGGTITPSGGVHISDGTRFVVQIQTGGAVGVATFKTSTDGGNTYGALQTSASSMTDATSGITLAFAGTLTAAGTATFRSAFTPQAQWRDQGGNGRSLVDHNGYRGGKGIFEFREDWIANIGTVSATAAPITALQRWSIVIANGATAQIAIPTSGQATPMMQLDTTNTNGSIGVLYTAGYLACVQTWTSLVWECDVIPSVLTGTWDFYAGLNDGNSTIVGGGNNNVYFHFSSATANITGEVRGATVAAAAINSGVSASVTGTMVRLRFEIHGTGSPYGSPSRVLFFVNDAFVGATTTNIPPTGMWGYYALGAGAITSASRFLIGGKTLVHNRYLSSPSL